MAHLESYKLTLFDVIVILLLLATSAIMLVRTGLIPGMQKGEVYMASVYHDGELITRLKLDQEQDIPLLDGKIMTQTRQGAVRIIRSDCPHQLCVNSGWIQYPGEVIVCAPNKILLELESTGSAVVDAVAY
jgi:hypothetical protein